MKWLKDIRLSDNLSLLKVSKSLGVSCSYISKLENGKRRPSIAMAKKLADFYKISWTKFFE